MKKGVNLWCFPAGKKILDCIKAAKKYGYDGVELNLAEEGEINLQTSDKDISKYAKAASDEGIEIISIATSLLWKYPLTDPDENVREKGRDIVKRMIDVAKDADTDSILVVPGLVNENVSYMRAYERAKKALADLSGYAEKNKVYICVENVWNKFLLSPLEMKRFIEETGSKYIKSYLDIGNMLQFGYPEDWIEVLGNLIKRVHVKDFDVSIGNGSGFKYLLEGSINWEKVMLSLKKVGYDGYLTAELSPYGTFPELMIEDTKRHMDAILSLIE